MTIQTKMAVIVASALILSACGGGGGGSGSSGPVASTLSFPLAQANANADSNTYNLNFNVSGQSSGVDVTGSGTISMGAAAGTTFEGQAAFYRTLTITGNFSANGKTVPYALSGKDYVTTNYEPLGSDFGPGSYCVVQGNPTYPSSVKVGDTGSLGSSKCYQDSSKSVLTETDINSYVIEADTASTAIFNSITNTYSLSGTIQENIQERWRIDQSGNVTFLSMTITDYTTSPTTVLKFTPA